MDQILLTLLRTLEEIGRDHPELYEPAAKQALTKAIFDGFLLPVSGFNLSHDYALDAADANKAVRSALTEYLREGNALAFRQGLTFHQRLAAFQDLDVATDPTQRCFNDFFAYLPPECYEADGTRVEL